MVREVRLEECRRGKATVYEKLRKRCGMILVDVKSRFGQKKDAQTRKKVRHAFEHTRRLVGNQRGCQGLQNDRTLSKPTPARKRPNVLNVFTPSSQESRERNSPVEQGASKGASSCTRVTRTDRHRRRNGEGDPGSGLSCIPIT